jgi:elongation factor 1-beta
VHHSFVSGAVSQSTADVDCFNALGNTDVSKYVAVQRWHKFVSSFSPSERKEWKSHPVEIEGFDAKKFVESQKAEDNAGFDDMFGEQTEEEKKEAEKKKKEAEAKKAGAGKEKKKVIEKSSILLEIKPWSSSTDMNRFEKRIRGIQLPSLKWNAAELKDLAYGVKVLHILCTIEDEKVTGQDLEDSLYGIPRDEDEIKAEMAEITEEERQQEEADEEYAKAKKRMVQSFDIISWNKCG